MHRILRKQPVSLIVPIRIQGRNCWCAFPCQLKEVVANQSVILLVRATGHLACMQRNGDLIYSNGSNRGLVHEFRAATPKNCTWNPKSTKDTFPRASVRGCWFQTRVFSSSCLPHQVTTLCHNLHSPFADTTLCLWLPPKPRFMIIIGTLCVHFYTWIQSDPHDPNRFPIPLPYIYIYIYA